MSSNSKIPAVIVGGSLNGLGVVRSLAGQRMPIVVIETTRLCPGGWSRLSKFVSVETLEGRPLVETLKQVSARLGRRPVLILTDDRAVQTVSKFREEIRPLFRFSFPDEDVLQNLMDKTLFQKLAEKENLPVPRAVILDSSAADFNLLHSLEMPVVIKPGNKKFVLNGNVERAVRASTLAEATQVSRKMLEGAENVIVQEWIDGPDTDIFFTLFACDSKSKVAALFSGRKVLCHPPAVGNTAVCVAAPEQAGELERWTRQFISLTNYRGLGSLEFKRDRRSGKVMIIEPTVGRTDWQEEIATLCGVNLPLIAYQIEVGGELKVSTPQPRSVAWRSARRHKPPAGVLLPDTRILGGYFLLKDPMPWVYYYTIERLLARAWRLGQIVFHETTDWLTSFKNKAKNKARKKARETE